MSNKLLGIMTAILGVLIFFSQNESAWIVSAILLGGGSGIFFWKK